MGAHPATETTYEEFYRARVAEFGRYLRGVLGREAQGAGGRVEVADTLQSAMLHALREWPDLAEVREDERDRRVYRLLRDAAGEALRRERGRRESGQRKPRMVSYDFASLDAEADDLPVREREITVAVLGATVRDVAADSERGEARAVLDRGVLLAGLRALSEQEAVVLIGVDHLDRDQRELADDLGLEFAALRQTLFVARKLFYGIVRHAVGVDLDEAERARLHAYLSGELSGRDRREVRRHLRSCSACQALARDLRVFGRNAHALLAPLPFVWGARTLVERASTKGAAAAGTSGTASGATGGTGATGASKGLFSQVGAAKVLGATAALLGVGAGVTGWLAEEQRHASPVVHESAASTTSRPSTLVVGGVSRLPAAATSRAAPKHTKPKSKKRATSDHAHHAKTSTQSSETASSNGSASASQPTTQTTPAAASTPTVPPSSSGTSPSTTGGGSSSKSGGSGGGEFFGQ